MQYHDYYSTLGIDKKVSANEIQRAYRKLARKYHPDINKDAGAETRFKEIGEAYEVLKDPEKREKYDRYGSAWKSAQSSGGAPPPGWEDFRFDFGQGGGARGFDGGGSGYSSFFDMLFGGGDRGFGGGPAPGGWSPQPPTGPQKGADAVSRISLRLEDAVAGGRRQIGLTDPASGSQRTLEVRIPAGVRTGQRIRLAGQGAPGISGGPPGDLLLEVAIAPHPRFEVDGRNLRSYLEVSPAVAALGGEVQVRTLDGQATVKLPPGSSTGRKIRLRGRGLPDGGNDAGDLLTEVRILVPDSLSDRERELYEQLAAVEDDCD